MQLQHIPNPCLCLLTDHGSKWWAVVLVLCCVCSQISAGFPETAVLSASRNSLSLDTKKMLPGETDTDLSLVAAPSIAGKADSLHRCL